ncbi:hypothetical protein FXB41_09370 [Bradyrhizobium canariense]|uniref:hypothetical protein n=1 Tax=Bradyrhizobium canariense TaxID=255045 RepID=UPI001CA5411B|nr:hypothetical protein [Bradyrhizobium canariense]MBW5434975.1 hypothetical protein [Bradyrhizobium canariense]
MPGRDEVASPGSIKPRSLLSDRKYCVSFCGLNQITRALKSGRQNRAPHPEQSERNADGESSADEQGSSEPAPNHRPVGW